MDRVYCENPDHNDGYVNRAVAHDMNGDCVWPHLIAPSGPCPIVGHPLTAHD